VTTGRGACDDRAMVGYSGTPLPKKLGIAAGHRVALIGAPDGFDATLGALPEGVVSSTRLASSGAYDVIVAFVRTRAALEDAFLGLAARLTPAGGLWIAWPKRASGVATDVTEDVVRAIALDAGLVDNKVCAIDATWSGLRCVVRLRDRPAATRPRRAR
jgi:hypothetical protein